MQQNKILTNMRKLFCTALCALMATLSATAESNPLEVKELKLSNGLTVWLNQ